MKIVKRSARGKKTVILTGKDKVNAGRLEKGEMFACPRCGKPVEFGADHCDKCHAFLNPETGEVRTQVSSDELNEHLQKSMKSSGNGKIYIIIGIIVFFLGAFIQGTVGTVMYIGGIVIAVIGILMIQGARNKFKMQLSQTLIPEVLADVFEETEYNPAGHISSNIIRSTNMFFPFRFNEIDGSDYIKAKYKGVGVEMSDITLIKVTTRIVTDEDGHDHEEEDRTTVFTGQWIICDFYKELSADLCVFEGGRKKKGQIETENEAFNKKYGISCSSPHDAFYILTPHMMENIMKMDERAGGDTYLHFVKDGKVHLAINSGRNHFEVGSLKNADVDALRRKFTNEVRYVTDLIDELLSIDTLYKQQ